MDLIYSPYPRRGWTVRFLTLVFTFQDIHCLGKIVVLIKRVVDYYGLKCKLDPSTPVTFLDKFTRVFIDSLLCGLVIFVIGDLNCNLLNDNYEAKALLEFCSIFKLSQLINSPTRTTESSQSLIDVIMATNNKLVGSSGVLTSSISDHNLIYLLMNLRVPRQDLLTCLLEATETITPELP